MRFKILMVAFHFWQAMTECNADSYRNNWNADKYRNDGDKPRCSWFGYQRVQL